MTFLYVINIYVYEELKVTPVQGYLDSIHFLLPTLDLSLFDDKTKSGSGHYVRLGPSGSSTFKGLEGRRRSETSW